MSINRPIFLFTTFPLLIICVSLITGCTSKTDESGITFSDYSQELKILAGSKATDCGWVEIGEKRETVDSCVEQNLLNKKPFYASYDRQGTDSRISIGIAFNELGEVHSVAYDSNPRGGFSNRDGRIIKSICDNVIMDNQTETDIQRVKEKCEYVFRQEELLYP